MKIAKVNCPVIREALKDRKTFWTLNLYLREFQRTDDGCFTSGMVLRDGALTLHFEVALEDYLFNEEGQEAEALWKFAEKLTGKKCLHWKIVKTIEL